MSARRMFFLSLSAAASLLAPTVAGASEPGCLPGQATSNEDQGIEVEAIRGEPLGIGRMTVRSDSARATAPDVPLELLEANGRALYPVFEKTSLLVSGGRDPAGPNSVTAYFLFRGKEPLQLNLRTDTDSKTTVTPTDDKLNHRRLQNLWWTCYVAAARDVARSDTYQPMVENYLTATLARRFGQPTPKLTGAWTPGQYVNEVFSLVTGAESVRLAAQTKVLLRDTGDFALADQPLPAALQPAPVTLPKFDDPADIEPIAHHVPVECFYVRCGNFQNFLWLRRTIDDWGTKVRDLASVRGLDYRIRERLERQLALRETILGRLLGEKVISDVVILGTDTFVREGAAIGILFEAKQSTVLKLQIDKMRQDQLEIEPTGKAQTVKIGGHDVAFLSTPSGEVRSFYAIDGDYHLVTTSRAIVERFFEAGRGKDSLAAAKEFRWARSKMPVSDESSVFVYLSDPFFRRMLSPHYRIEMTRRVRAASEIDVVRLAQLAASAEGVQAKTVEQLIAADLLPEGFGKRPDGSHVVTGGKRVYDSLRGAAGAFVPVPDVEITGATASEVAAYKQFALVYRSQWQRMDPVLVRIKRGPLADRKERVTLDVHITPYARTRYEFATQILMISDKLRWVPVPGDIASVEANVGGSKYAIGVRDFVPQFAIRNGAVQYSGRPEEQIPVHVAGRRGSHTVVVPYVGDYLLDRAIEQAKAPDRDGIRAVSGMFLGDLLYKKSGAVDVIALKRNVLKRAARHRKIVDAERPAKIRIRIADLADTKFADVVQAEGYVRARRVSAGNVYLLGTLTSQLHVPADKAKATAETLLGAALACPLEGRYELTKGFDLAKRWRSTKWEEESLNQVAAVPKDFRAPLVDWFAGALIEFDIDNTSITTHIELDVRPKKP